MRSSSSALKSPPVMPRWKTYELSWDASSARSTGVLANHSKRPRGTFRVLQPIRGAARTLSEKSPYPLLLGFERLLGLLEKFVLEPQAHLIGFDCPDHIRHAIRPGFHIEFPQRLVRARGVARVVFGKFCVPPDARINAGRQILPVLIGAGFRGGALQVHQVGPGDHDV